VHKVRRVGMEGGCGGSCFGSVRLPASSSQLPVSSLELLVLDVLFGPVLGCMMSFNVGQ
jgi:hypothetical protein